MTFMSTRRFMVGAVSTSLQIKDVARRSGCSPATLRYYEDIGLLRPSGRTAAGYRVYDAAALERLAFINRAKQLGCSLDEVADLTKAWDGGECGPVQERLQALVSSKLAAARAQIVALEALIADLEVAADSLSAGRPAGACDETCGCLGSQTVAFGARS